MLRQIEEGGTYSQYDEPLFWLDDSMICNLCYKCSDPNVGLALNKVDSAVKCYMGDTGLLVISARNIGEGSVGCFYLRLSVKLPKESYHLATKERICDSEIGF